MIRTLLALTLLLTFALVNANWEGCGSGKVIKGEKTYICLIISDIEDWNGSAENGDVVYYRYLFRPTVDDFTKLSLQDSWILPGSSSDCQNCGSDNDVGCPSCKDTLLRNFTNPAVHVQSIQSISYIRRYRGEHGGVHRTFPYMTAIINVDKGEITGITWDEGCTFCNDAQCTPNTYNFNGALQESGPKSCYLDDTDCTNGDLVAESCPLQVYAVWSGTDADGNYLKSSELRFSEFKSMSLTNWADKIKTKYEEVKDYAEYEEGGDSSV
ncbi:hypothetical protein TrLO_g14128 [Triparma laevis f. longispina]|uniref:Uncharacterized protein n=1 Tax=Triparma laevis f. longispina TaxID=1714387 RepID=A0A9W7C349_9STRA|nr:hypothetical protein TrLO_g14128 [Triparma laevis f. longispina]